MLRPSTNNPFDRFAIEPSGADRKAVGRVVQDEDAREWHRADAIEKSASSWPTRPTALRSDLRDNPADGLAVGPKGLARSASERVVRRAIERVGCRRTHGQNCSRAD